MSEELVTSYIEMTSLADLQPGRPPAVPVELVETMLDQADLLRQTYMRVGSPYGWREEWDDARWAEYFASGRRWWLLRSGSAVAGAVVLDEQPNGDTEIDVFGLVPEFVGRGIGAEALRLAVEQAWALDRRDGQPTRRVWLHTYSEDHPNALQNYLQRGFRVFKTTSP